MTGAQNWFDENRAPPPRESKVLPGTKIDHTFGACLCWLCRDRDVSKQERDWMFAMLAKDALRKPAEERDRWLLDWELRHGRLAGRVLRLHIQSQAKAAESGIPAYADFTRRE